MNKPASQLAIYAGTFDPITLGHMDLSRRASQIFSQVVVCVAENPNKQRLFSLEERVSMARELLSPFANIRVLGDAGLLIKFMQRENAKVLIRGLRAASDFEYEFQLAGMNRKLYPELETVFLTPSEEYMFISATMVKEIAALGGNVSKFVHPFVEGKLQEKFKRGH